MSRVLAVPTNTHLELIGLTVVNGRASDGGCIRWAHHSVEQAADTKLASRACSRARPRRTSLSNERSMSTARSAALKTPPIWPFEHELSASFVGNRPPISTREPCCVTASEPPCPSPQLDEQRRLSSSTFHGRKHDARPRRSRTVQLPCVQPWRRRLVLDSGCGLG